MAWVYLLIIFALIEEGEEIVEGITVVVIIGIGGLLKFGGRTGLVGWGGSRSNWGDRD